MNAAKEAAQMKEKTHPPTDVGAVAELIGLDDPTLLGTQPLEVGAATLDKLRRYGRAAELNTREAGVILGVSRFQVGNYCLSGKEAVKLGHRRRGRILLIPVPSLVAFVKAANKPPVPTSGERPGLDLKRAREADERVRKAHKLPPKARA